ncbi:MAG: outer membrane beta-barrel protein [Bacteroidetes bacterium]|nr:outer membrane beta-barrel protein [Bacteroidota bacterium]
MILFLTAFTKINAQFINANLYDLKKYHFGYVFGPDICNLKIVNNPDFLLVDSVKSVGYTGGLQGFHLGALADFRMGQSFNLRAMFTISFAYRNMNYVFTNPKTPTTAKMESTYLNVPILIKYKSDLHVNWRYYLITGPQYSYDLSSQKNTRRSVSEPIVALKPNGLSYVMGFGWDIYYPYFKFSPEIKLVQSVNNMLVKDKYIYSQVLSGVYPRFIVLSITFE